MGGTADDEMRPETETPSTDGLIVLQADSIKLRSGLDRKLHLNQVDNSKAAAAAKPPRA
jgi:hypothetical protein